MTVHNWKFAPICLKISEILQNKTEYVLRKLGFVWPSITEEVIDGYFKAAKLNI